MEDNELIEEYFNRSEAAISDTQHKYGRLIYSIAMNILGDEFEAEECESDVYMALWNAIPPKVPNSLRDYACGIARNLAHKRVDYENRKKRSAIMVAYEELAEVLTVPSAADEYDNAYIGEFVSEFLAKQDKLNRVIFISHFYYGDSASDISKRVGLSVIAVNMRLHKTKKALKEALANL